MKKLCVVSFAINFLLILIIAVALSYYWDKAIHISDLGKNGEIARISLNNIFVELKLKGMINNHDHVGAHELIDTKVESDLFYVQYFDVLLQEDENYNRLKSKVIPQVYYWMNHDNKPAPILTEFIHKECLKYQCENNEKTR